MNNSNTRIKRAVIHSTEAFEIATCEWSGASEFEPQSFGWSLCSVLIQEGRFEVRLDLGLRKETLIREAGQVITTPLGGLHEIRCVSEFGRTLHVFTKKTSETGMNAKASLQKFSTPSLSHLKGVIDLKLGEQPTTWAQLETNLKSIAENSITTSSPYFMNQLFSGVFPETLASEAVLNQARTTMATFEASPAFTAIELEVVDRLGELIGWKDSDRDGVGVPGGSAANLMAVHCARHKRIPEFRKLGPRGEKFKVFVSKAAHYSLKKACLATGLGTDALIAIDTDSNGRIRIDQLKSELESSKRRGETPLLVCATAGTTVLGAFDPLNAIADLCQSFSVWLHVDAAWGGPVLFSTKNRQLMDGVERADSVTFDAHKLFGSRLTSSFFLTRHRGLLFEANDSGGDDYLFHAEKTELDRGRSSWQCGRGAEALSFWSLWKSQGTNGLGQFVERLFDVRDESVRWIKEQPGLTLISDPTFLNICVRIKSKDPEASLKAREKMKADDFAFVNFSSDREGSFLRLILAHPKTDVPLIRAILQRALES